MTTYKTLRNANEARQIEYGIQQVPVPLSFRALEWLGEVGELAETTLDMQGTMQQLRDEMADVLITTDLLLIDLNIDDIDVLKAPTFENYHQSISDIVSNMLRHATVVGNQVKKVDRLGMGFKGSAPDYATLRENIIYTLTDVYALASKGSVDTTAATVSKFNAHSATNGFQTRFDPNYETSARQVVESTPAAPDDHFADAFPPGAKLLGIGLDTDPELEELMKALGFDLPVSADDVTLDPVRYVKPGEDMVEVVRNNIRNLQAEGFDIDHIDIIDKRTGKETTYSVEEILADGFTLPGEGPAPDAVAPKLPPNLERAEKALTESLRGIANMIGLDPDEAERIITDSRDKARAKYFERTAPKPSMAIEGEIPDEESHEWVEFTQQFASNLRLGDENDLADELDEMLRCPPEDQVIPTINFPILATVMLKSLNRSLRERNAMDRAGRSLTGKVCEWVAKEYGDAASMKLLNHLIAQASA